MSDKVIIAVIAGIVVTIGILAIFVPEALSMLLVFGVMALFI